MHFANRAKSLSMSKKQRVASIGTYTSRQLASAAAASYKIIFSCIEIDGKSYETYARTFVVQTAQELSLVSATSFFWKDAEIDFDVGKR